MRIFEHQGKELFRKYGIPVPQGVMIDEKREIGKIFPDIDKGNGVVLKAQVLVGGRRKAKGIRFAESARECESYYDELSNLNISGHPVRKILLEEKIKIQQKFYLGITIDTETPQAFPLRKLGIGKAEKLIVTGKFSDPLIAFVFLNAFVKLIPWQMLQYMCENRFPGIHRQPSLPLLRRRYRPANAM